MGNHVSRFFEIWDDVALNVYGEYRTLDEAYEAINAIVAANDHIPDLRETLVIYVYEPDGSVYAIA
jgi:hypothetical protein